MKPPESTSYSKPATPMFWVMVSSRYIWPTSSMLPMRRRVKLAMLLAVIVCCRDAGRKALPLKIVSVVGVPPKPPRGRFHENVLERPWMNWPNTLRLSLSS